MGGVEVPQAPRGFGYPPPHWGRVWWGGCVPSPENFPCFFIENTIFWRLLARLFLKSHANGIGSNPNPPPRYATGLVCLVFVDVCTLWVRLVTVFFIVLSFCADYPLGDECEDIKCGFYAKCQIFDPDNNDVNNDVINDVNNDVTQVGSGRGRARCVCPAFCPKVGAETKLIIQSCLVCLNLD